MGGAIWLPNLTAVFEFLYKFFNKFAILGPACGGVQAIRPFILLVRLVELSLAIGILITILLQSCKFGARVVGHRTGGFHSDAKIESNPSLSLYFHDLSPQVRVGPSGHAHENHVLCLCSAGFVTLLGLVGLGRWAGLGNEVATMLQQMSLTSGCDQGGDV